MVGGTKLFELVVLCDLVLGPLISLVIYDSTKARWKLVMDYSIIGAIQLAAMIYGVYIVAGTRPVYVAFNKDRIEVVTARDIDDQELAAARDPGLCGSAAGRPAPRRGPGTPGRPAGRAVPVARRKRRTPAAEVLRAVRDGARRDPQAREARAGS